MSAITFIGEGPSPREIDQLYHLDLPPPLFRERYPGEYAAMYRANGFMCAAGIWFARHAEMTVAEIMVGFPEDYVSGPARTPEGPNIMAPEDCYLGPAICDTRVVMGSVAWWRPMKSAPLRPLSSMAQIM